MNKHWVKLMVIHKVIFRSVRVNIQKRIQVVNNSIELDVRLSNHPSDGYPDIEWYTSVQRS